MAVILEVFEQNSMGVTFYPYSYYQTITTLMKIITKNSITSFTNWPKG